MCADCLVVRLSGPMQSWGLESRFNRRDTNLMPTRSAVAGLLCAALGISRGEEAEFLSEFGKVAFSSYAIPRKLSWSDKADFFSEATGSGKALKIQKTIDFHTVMGTVKADGGKESNAVLTYRQYLSDVTFLVLLEGDAAFLRRLAAALEDPVWGVWLGRKSCIPSEPVFGGLFANQKSAVDSLIGENWLIREEEVGAFAEGSVVQKDIPVGFDPRKRTHGVRRVRREYRRE